MTNKQGIYLTLGIMCFALTAGICVQIKTVKSTNTTVSQSYTENNLRAEVLKYKEKYDNKLKEIERADDALEIAIAKATANNSELEEAQNQITEGNKILGLTEVKGPGVIIKVSDSKIDASTVVNPSLLLVHDKDILSIVNELKNAGAEAISINGQRVISTTAIICGGNIININGEKIGTPFEIQAIGLPETLANLDRPGGYLELLKESKINVKLEKSNDITIPKYSGVLNFKYMKSVK